MVDRALITLVEGAYDLHAPDETWLVTLGRRIAAAYGAPMGVFAYEFDVDDAGVRPRSRFLECDIDAAPLLDGMFTYASPEAVHRFFRFGPSCGSFADALAETTGDEPLEEQGRAMWRAAGCEDLFVVRVAGPPGRFLHVTIPRERFLGRTSERTRTRWSRVAAHLSAAYRLRTVLGDVDARFGSEGSEGSEGSAVLHESAQQKLRRSIRARERARGELGVDDPDRALEIWRGLVDGRWSLVDEYEEDGRRYVVARRNPLGTKDPRGFTEREHEVAELLANGASTKEVAYALGISVAAVGAHVKALVTKVGARNRTHLITALRHRLRPLGGRDVR
ncbi:MAG: helix-turn-helix transcriptional regulator [Sandaracinus sp.]|nr:helix-turn-helix transcriptional regulator [Sandaracinus sp.]MCB9618145.1 helix-turn-helix transcriptional regulator [Sandaracinus sp.]MCB9624146.1 helix-turn-helix transcriptional regulator [Sandaracinus sp.]MCB9636523.1 helix-turn-helix transcriptional regulator [Sandaracinus sp.]